MDSLPVDLRDELAHLRARYVAGLGVRLHEVEETFERFESQGAAAVEPLRMACHRFAGSAAVYGLDDVSAAARVLFNAVDPYPVPSGEGGDKASPREAVRRLAEAVVHAGGERRGSRIANYRGVERRKHEHAGDRRSGGG